MDAFYVLLSADNPSSELQIEFARAAGTIALPFAAGVYFYTTTRDLINTIEEKAETQIKLNKELTDKQIEISGLKMEALFKQYFGKLKSGK